MAVFGIIAILFAFYFALCAAIYQFSKGEFLADMRFKYKDLINRHRDFDYGEFLFFISQEMKKDKRFPEFSFNVLGDKLRKDKATKEELLHYASLIDQQKYPWSVKEE